MPPQHRRMRAGSRAFEWIDVSALEGVSDEEAGALLEKAYKGFSVN